MRADARQVLAGLFGQVVASALYGVTFVVVARNVSVSVFGQLAVGCAIALIGKDVLDLGRSATLVKFQAAGTHGSRELALRLIRAKLRTVPVLFAVLAAASLVLDGTVHGYMLLFGLYAAAAATFHTLSVPLYGRADLGAAGRCSLVERGVMLAAVCGSISWLGPSALPLGLALGALAVCLQLARAPWSPVTDEIALPELTRRSRPMAVVSLTTDARQLDAPIVSTVAGPVVGGIYSAASRLIGPLSMALTQVEHLIYGRASRAHEPLSPQRAVALAVGLAIVYAPLLVLIALESEAIFGALMGDHYRESAGLMPILCIGFAIGVVAAPLTGWVQARGPIRLASVAFSLSLSVYLVVLVVGSARGSMTLIASAFPVMQAVTVLTLGLGLVWTRRKKVTRVIPHQIPRNTTPTKQPQCDRSIRW